MSRFDSFFETPVDPKHQNEVLKKAQNELEKNRIANRRKNWILFLSPVFASFVAFFIFRQAGSVDPAARVEAPTQDFNDLQSELLTELETENSEEHDDILETMSEMSLLEELEFLEDDEDWEDQDV